VNLNKIGQNRSKFVKKLESIETIGHKRWSQYK